MGQNITKIRAKISPFFLKEQKKAPEASPRRGGFPTNTHFRSKLDLSAKCRAARAQQNQGPNHDAPQAGLKMSDMRATRLPHSTFYQDERVTSAEN